jgi:hypothetical protein
LYTVIVQILPFIFYSLRVVFPRMKNKGTTTSLRSLKSSIFCKTFRKRRISSSAFFCFLHHIKMLQGNCRCIIFFSYFHRFGSILIDKISQSLRSAKKLTAGRVLDTRQKSVQRISATKLFSIGKCHSFVTRQ